MALSETDRRLIEAIQDGLPLVSHPYRAIGEAVGLPEAEVMARITALLDDGVIKRLGVVVRHRELGYNANAMVVHDLPDESVDAVAERLAEHPAVTLCYRRPRRGKRWPYNLFCMVHGRDRPSVLAEIERLRAAEGITGYAHAVLFSTRRFKQRGARYLRRVDASPSREAAANG